MHLKNFEEILRRESAVQQHGALNGVA